MLVAKRYYWLSLMCISTHCLQANCTLNCIFQVSSENDAALHSISNHLFTHIYTSAIFVRWGRFLNEDIIMGLSHHELTLLTARKSKKNKKIKRLIWNASKRALVQSKGSNTKFIALVFLQKKFKIQVLCNRVGTFTSHQR